MEPVPTTEKSVVSFTILVSWIRCIAVSRPHCKDTIPKNLKQKFPEKELSNLSPNFRIHVSVSDLYIPRISPPILLQENM
jgi:hypothetical protein